MPTPTNLVDVLAVDTSRLSWDVFTVPQSGAQIPVEVLLDDPDTEMQAFLMRYAAGLTNV